MKPIKPWQDWVSIDLAIGVVVTLCLIGLAFMMIMVRGF